MPPTEESTHSVDDVKAMADELESIINQLRGSASKMEDRGIASVTVSSGWKSMKAGIAAAHKFAGSIGAAVFKARTDKGDYGGDMQPPKKK